MKRLIIFIVVVISIPFFVVQFVNVDEKELKEIKLNYLSNVIVRVKREATGQIDNVFLEEYIVGVVAGEMPVSFEIEALKAQSVASRSYVLKRLGNNNEYDVVDTISNQVYLDEDTLIKKWQDNYVTYINKVREAVNATSMEYLEYNGEIIDAMFFSTSNGYTEDSGVVFSHDLPYLQSVESSWDEAVSSVFQDSITMSLQEFYERLDLPYQSNLSVEILKKSSSNRVVSLKINDKEFTGREVYQKLKIRSCDFEIQLLGSNVLINTKGYGHGVGMSQYGAQGMAKEGYSYREILAHYYTNTVLKEYNTKN